MTDCHDDEKVEEYIFRDVSKSMSSLLHIFSLLVLTDTSAATFKDEDIKLCLTSSVLLSFVTNQRKAIGRRK